MKPLVHTMLITGTALFTSCSNSPYPTSFKHVIVDKGSIQQKETMLKVARACTRLRKTVEKKTKEYSHLITRYKTGVGQPGSDDFAKRIALSKDLRDQALQFRREMHLINQFCMIMGPCPTYHMERAKLDASIQKFAALEKSLQQR